MFHSSLRFQIAVLASFCFMKAVPASAGADQHLPKESIAKLSQFCRAVENDPTRPRVESSEASCIALGLKYLTKNSGATPLSFEDQAGLFIGVCSQLNTVVAYSESSESSESGEANSAATTDNVVDHAEIMARRSSCYKTAYDELAKVQPALMAQFAQPNAVEWQKSDGSESNESDNSASPEVSADASPKTSDDSTNCTEFSGVTVLGLKANGVLGRRYSACEMADQADVLYDWKGAAVFYVRYHSEWRAPNMTRALATDAAGNARNSDSKN